MVYARFTPTLANVTAKAVTQWDYGRKLRIEGLDLPTAVRIDFGISGDQTTVARIGLTKDRVTDVVIPDSLLEQSSNIVAYVYVSDTTEGKTVRTINIPVTARAKPEEHDTPESKELFAEAIEAVNDVAVRAENAETSAKSHADSAKESLEATERIAQTFADTAQNAVNAVNSAGAAQVKAVSEKGAEAVSEVSTTGETHRKAVAQAGTGAVADVEAKKQESVAAVKVEGEAQLQTIAEETAQIVADREQISKNTRDIDTNTRNKAGAIVLDAEGESIALNDASDYPLQGLKLFGKSTQDGTPTPDAPVDIVSVENPEVAVHGKNLLSVDRYTVNGSSLIMYLFAGSVKLPVTFSWKQGFDRKIGSALFTYEVDGNTLFKAPEETSGHWSMVINEGDTLTKFTLVNWGLETGELSEMQLEKGETATAFEKPTTQLLPLARTLPGIPVASGGNYTDANGQQWICDEVDLKRGVYVQRVKSVILDGTETWNAGSSVINGMHRFFTWAGSDMKIQASGFGMCSHYPRTPLPLAEIASDCVRFGENNTALFFFSSSITDVETWKAHISALANSGNPIEAKYILATPIETPLSDAEITAFKALHSNKPNTTILNDAGAHMAVEYVADTKTYIDRQIAALLSNET